MSTPDGQLQHTQRQRVPLDEQIREVEREIRQRARLYPEWIAKGRYKPETAEAKLAAMRAAHDTLMWLEANIDWIKLEAARRAHEKRLAAEADSLREHPAVQTVFDAFPDATISDVRNLKGAQSP